MVYLGSALITAVAAVVEAAWAPWLFWSGERPELTVAATVVLGLVAGPRWGLSCGFFAALFRGALLRETYGSLFVAMMGLGLLAGAGGHRVIARRMIAACASAGIGILMFRLVMALFHPAGELGLTFWGALRASLYSAVATVPIYLLAAWGQEVALRSASPGLRWR
ncbi:MAG: hypothetical protein N2512_00780 [Armatimonadetes bacterium]|nr:hypothetical protein [Armatimonadota bacterium]